MPAEEKECPFCGSNRGVHFLYGTDSCKWGAARCIDCGAQAPEVRTGYDESEDAGWHKDALEEWNRRANTKECARQQPTTAPACHAGE
jgi:Lar family restriction alleviation protein